MKIEKEFGLLKKSVRRNSDHLFLRTLSSVERLISKSPIQPQAYTSEGAIARRDNRGGSDITTHISLSHLL